MRFDLAFAAKISSQNQLNSLMATILAITVGYWLYRQLIRYPSIQSAYYIFPAFIAAYGLVLSAFFFLRLDYSRLFFAISFFNSIVWFLIVHIITIRYSRPIFDVIPFGNAESVASIAGAEWQVISTEQPRFTSRDGLVVDLRANLTDDWEALVTERALSGTPVYHYKQLKETLTGRVEIEHLSENTLGSLLPDHFYLKFKRGLDLIGVALILPFALALMCVVSLWVRLDDGGPVFFRQTRMGYRGQEFQVWKFRTMRTANIESVGTVDSAKTRDDDERITRIGHFLRKTRIDELPQIFNIIKGEMSWIGPRPEAVPLSMLYQSKLPYYRYRHIVRPGITGWAQVNQGHVAEVDEVLDKLHYDFFYIKNFSIWLDLLITLRTIRVVLTGFGAK